jgi:feruloyl-CoA synthase
MIFPNRARCQGMAPGVLEAEIRTLLAGFAAAHPGTSTAIRRAAILDEPPAIDAGELTEKGSVNQKAVLRHRAAIVDQLFAQPPSSALIDIHEGHQLDNAAR